MWKVGRRDGGSFACSGCLRTATQNHRRRAIADAFAVAILAGAAGTTGGRVESAQLRQALLFGREGGLEGVRQLGIVHGDDPEPGLQLEDLYFSPCQFEIDGF